MHKLVILFSVPLLVSLASLSYGQAGSGFFYQLNARHKRPALSAYPRRIKLDTTYILNGQQTNDADYVRSVLTSQSVMADTLISRLLPKSGKIELVIHYSHTSKP